MERNNGESCEDIKVLSRVVGFYTETASWNPGKEEEFRMRKTFDLNKALAKPLKNRSALSVD